LKVGLRQASLIVDDGEFEIYRSFAEARAYLMANIEWILERYEDSHHVSRYDIILVSFAAPGASLAVDIGLTHLIVPS
jgi:hypothetical protein